MAIVQPRNEQERLETLRALKLVNSDRLPEYDAVVELAASVFDCPIALISFVEEDEQWFKASCGLNVEGTPREVSFCQHTILSDEILIVPNALEDERFKGNPLVLGEPNIRFYAGCPITMDGEFRLGTLCVIDSNPRSPDEIQLTQLRHLATVVEGLVKTQRATVEKEQALQQADKERLTAERNSALLEEVAAASGVGGWEMCLATNELTWTKKTRDIHEVPADFVPNVDTALSFYPPASREVITSAIENALETKSGWDVELPFITAKGRQIWVRAAGHPVRKNGEITHLVGAFQDVTKRKIAEQEVRHSEAVHRTTLEAVTEGILVLGRSGRIQSANPAAATLLGRFSNDLSGKFLRDLEIEIEGKLTDDGEVLDPLELAVRDPQIVSDVTAKLKRPDGQLINWVKINAMPIDQEGEFGLDGVVVSLADISGTKSQADTLQVIFDNLPGGVAYYDDSFQLTSYNADFGRLLGYPDDMLKQKLHILDYLKFSAELGDYGKGDAEKLALEKFKRHTPDKPFNYERRTANGKYLEIRCTPLPNSGAIFNFFDVTSRKKMERDLANSERLARHRSQELETVLANMRQGVSVFDDNGRITLWNQQYLDIFSKPEGEVVKGKSLQELIQAEKDRGDFEGDVEAHITDLMTRMVAGEIVRSKFAHTNGKIVSVIHAPLPGGGWIGTHEDITLREQAAARITHAAHHDSLTGLANRTLFNSTMIETLSNAQIHTQSGNLLLLDLDKFKPVNDTYGHDVGDDLLKQVAIRLKDCVRSSDLVARLGGDEFAIILPRTGANTHGTAEIASRIVDSLRKPFKVFAEKIEIGVSIGIAPILATDNDTSTIIKKADIALYEVKNQGRNDFRFYDDESMVVPAKSLEKVGGARH